jgi:hypothetical protein
MPKRKKKKTDIKKKTKELKDRFAECKRLVTNSYSAFDSFPTDVESYDSELLERYYAEVVEPHLKKLEKLVKEYDKVRGISKYNYRRENEGGDD